MANDCNQTCLPSSNSAYAVVHDIPGGLLSMGIHFLGRSAIIGTGLYVAGFRGKEWLKGSIGGALVMEASLLVWAMFQKKEELTTVPVEDDVVDAGPTSSGDGWQALTIPQPEPKTSDKPPKELPDYLTDFAPEEVV